MPQFLRSTLILLGLAAILSGCAQAPGRSSFWRAGAACAGSAANQAAARRNAASLDGLQIDLFGRPETGWAIYAPLAAREIATQCAPQTAGFAAAWAAWQAEHGLAATGEVDGAELLRMKADWQARRPFLALRAKGICPDPPPFATLQTAGATETLGDKPIRLRARALAAYRRMIAAARVQPAIGDGDPDLFKLFSGYRDPAADAARCAAQNNCQGLVRAVCSAHRTGLALDLDVGSAPGLSLDNSADANRLYQSRTAAYLWLVRNAGRFGFVNYGFEPWHWEWTGEAP